MKVILLADVKDIGKADTIVSSSSGYARNFLFPKNLAVEASVANLKSLDTRKNIADEKHQQEVAIQKEIAAKLNNKTVELKVDSGTSGKLFGAVTHANIANAVHEQTGIEIDKRKVILDDPIKSIGTFDVNIKLHPEVLARIKVNVASSSK